jgi:putative redox protein
MVNVEAHIKQTKYEMVIKNGRRELVADEPAGQGGTDLGFAPTELLCSALAACTCATLRMYADRKRWNLTDIKVDIQFVENTEKHTSTINRKITLSGNLSQEQRERLLYIADHCPVHKILSNPIEIETKLLN